MGATRVFSVIIAIFAALVFVVAPAEARHHRDDALNVGTARIDGIRVRYVIAQLDRVHVQAALGGPYVGDTAWLAQIASHDHAIAAINGGYFECYNRKAPRKNLDQTTIVNGHMVFRGDVGSVLYFDRDNHATIMRIPLRIAGSLDGNWTYPNNWYAYWFNRLPTDNAETITIFTPAWGQATGLGGGPQIQVTDGVVTKINYNSTAIPPDGYVIYFRGEVAVASRFWVGRRVSYTVTTEDGYGIGDFANAWQAIGGGPQILVEGMETAPGDAAAEGFTDPKVLHAGTRSMVGVSQDQSELIFAVAHCTLDQCAHVMKTLGAYDAMNLDGGASTGLWADGKYVVKPGREINNALVLTE